MLSSSRMRLLHSFFLLLLIVLPTFSIINSYHSSSDLSSEKGEPHFDRIICTDSGLCLIFYHRVAVYGGDAVTINGPYVKAVHITPSGGIINPSSSYDFSSKVDVWGSFNTIAFVEEIDSFRYIGSDSGSIYEIWWLKANNSIIFKDEQITAYNEIQLVTHHVPDDYFTMINNSLEGIEETIIPLSLKEFSAPDKYLFDNTSSSFFVFFKKSFYTGTRVIIRRLFTNGSYFHESIVDLGLAANHYYLNPIIGGDGSPYLGIWWRNDEKVEDYNFTLLLVNLLSKSTFNHSFMSPYKHLDHKVLIDTSGCTHLLLNYYTYISQYLKFSSNHTFDFQVTLTVPDSDRYSFPSDSFNLFQNNLLIGGVESDDSAGIVVINSSTGQLISINSSLIPYIPFSDGSFITFNFFGIFPFLILLVFLRKKKISTV